MNRLKCSFLTLFLLSLTACSSAQQEPNVEPVPRTKLIKPQPCNAMPPMRDTSKLEQSLRKRGIITPEMSADEAKAKVTEYINMRQKAFDACRKGS